MRLLQTQLHITNAQMDYTITDPVQRIEQKPAELSISQPAATIEIHSTNPKLHINMDQMWSDLGMKPTGDVIREYAQKGRQEAMKGISRRVGEGRQMMLGAGKDQGAATLQGIAKQNHGPKRAGPYNIKFIPSVGSVKVDITPGTFDINIQQNKPKIDVQVNKPKMDFTYGDVRGTMVVRPDLEIDVIG